MTEPNEMDVVELVEALDSGELAASSAVEATLQSIDERADLNAFVSVAERETLLERAREVDRRRDDGDEVGPLAGVPVAVKDNICTRELPTTAGSRMLEGFESPYRATVVRALEEAGALIVGKTNLDEFGMGSSNENSHFGPVRHPDFPERTPGGSSGGSAAAVAADCCGAALGSDTGGSVRQPASHCGIVGLKPTYGRVSRYGLVAYASSLDQIGPLTKSIDDAALMMETLAGHDPHDANTVDREVPAYTGRETADPDELRIGVPEEIEATDSALATPVERAFRSTLDALRAEGVEIETISLPHTEYAVAAYYLLATAEASSNLARYDGVRYGHRADAEDFEDLVAASRAEGFGEEVKRRIALGTWVLSAGYYEQYYEKAQKVRTLVSQDYEHAFSKVDLVATPTTPTPAFELGEKVDDPLEMYMQDVFTTPPNLAGLPALGQPCGRADDGRPIGFQLTGPTFGEDDLLAAGRLVESVV